MKQTVKYNDYRVTYFFNHSKMGFSNSVTVNAMNIELAIEQAKKEVAGCYGSKMFNKFSFGNAEIVKK